MESDDIGNLCLFSCQHCQRWHESMTSLAMNKIPCTIFDNRKYLRGNAVVTLRGPSPNTNNAHFLYHLLTRKWSSRGIWHSCKNRDADSSTRKTASNFIDVRFNTTHIREISRSDHQNVKSTCFSYH